MLTASLCSRLSTKSHQTTVGSHCSCTSHGLVLNASRNLDGSGAWSQTTTSGKVSGLSRSRGVVCVISKHGGFAGTVEGTSGEEHRINIDSQRWKQRAQRTLDTYPKIMDAVSSFLRASRFWNVSADGDPLDVYAMKKGKGKGEKGKGKGNDKGKSSENENKDATDNQSDR